MDSKPFAEHAALAINGILQKLAETYQLPTLQYEEVESKKNIGSSAKGLYMIFVRPKGSDQLLRPAYVGYTGRSFRVRFREHAYDEGVIGKFFLAQQDSLQKYELCVSEFPCRPMIAKLLESIFLEAFDFAFNKQENGHERETADLYAYNPQNKAPYQKCKEIFKKGFEKVVKEVENVKGAVDKL